ncbi:hypothetical protein Pyn_40640 [Prunus yedoensis var. nudiflora]|uniref:Uncharacterized protein n=1 Tax=Prunus yedoensis var. nudiflora TaxID=2094558 RepID=A0A314ZL45_PRUYE|nr:hypothetical protein Pyn_40640 [Prunus yedoensis var. nudiflora]
MAFFGSNFLTGPYLRFQNVQRCRREWFLPAQKCDQWVHGANFLALRHVRCLLCNTCQNLTQRYVVGISVEKFWYVTTVYGCLLPHEGYFTARNVVPMLGLESKQGSGHQNKNKKEKKHGDSQSASKFWPEKIANHRVQN